RSRSIQTIPKERRSTRKRPAAIRCAASSPAEASAFAAEDGSGGLDEGVLDIGTRLCGSEEDRLACLPKLHREINGLAIWIKVDLVGDEGKMAARQRLLEALTERHHAFQC